MERERLENPPEATRWGVGVNDEMGRIVLALGRQRCDNF